MRFHLNSPHNTRCFFTSGNQRCSRPFFNFENSGECDVNTEKLHTCTSLIRAHVFVPFLTPTPISIWSYFIISRGTGSSPESSLSFDSHKEHWSLNHIPFIALQTLLCILAEQSDTFGRPAGREREREMNRIIRASLYFPLAVKNEVQHATPGWVCLRLLPIPDCFGFNLALFNSRNGKKERRRSVSRDFKKVLSGACIKPRTRAFSFSFP